MANYNILGWNQQFLDPQQYIDPTLFQPVLYAQCDGLSVNSTTDFTPPPNATSNETSPSPDTLSDATLEGPKLQQSKKRRKTSDCSQSDALVRTRKTRKLRAPNETARVREKGACFLCQKKRKPCQDGNDPGGSCRRCLAESNKITIIPGLLRPLCWRPNIGYTEVFRRGPTIDFAASLRGNSEDAGPGKQALWKHFATRRHGSESPKTVQLSQNWTSNKLRICLDRYRPKETDKQHYLWFDDGTEKKYLTPPYGITDLAVASSTIERFLAENFHGYIEAHLRNANEITRRTFQAAETYKRLPLVESALKLWVGCRFIEEPWSIVGSETLGMSLDPSQNCPYHERIPVPPIVDLQIDLIVINALLQPELKKILHMLKKKLESNDPWTDWFEIYLANFILLHNVELTMAHDAWFVKRNNLKRKYSNKPLVNTIIQGATTLLTCFHYAHQGYAPFSNLELEHTQQWSQEQKEYLQEIRPMLQQMRGDHAHDPAKELFWTSQLHKPDWRPVVLVS